MKKSWHFLLGGDCLVWIVLAISIFFDNVVMDW
jgi:hypothetical protein